MLRGSFLSHKQRPVRVSSRRLLQIIGALRHGNIQASTSKRPEKHQASKNNGGTFNAQHSTLNAQGSGRARLQTKTSQSLLTSSPANNWGASLWKHPNFNIQASRETPSSREQRGNIQCPTFNTQRPRFGAGKATNKDRLESPHVVSYK